MPAQIREAWHWPTFGYCFFEFDSHRDADDAMKKLHGSKTVEGKNLLVLMYANKRLDELMADDII